MNESINGADKKLISFRIETNKTLGRYLVAAKDLKAGEQILIEQPLVIGPRADSSPLCLNCYQSFVNKPKVHVCSKCQLAPMCANCSNIPGVPLGHSNVECLALKSIAHSVNSRQILENLQIILPLRSILLLKTDKKLWDQLMQLEGHSEKRRNTPIWNMHQKNIINILREWNLLNDNITDEVLQHLIGILDVNCFEVRVPRVNDLGDMPLTADDCIRGLYMRASLMAHDCISNTHIALDDKFNMTVRCSVDVKNGEPIYFNYTNTLLGTYERQEHLREGKYFDCFCARCSDPTELETNLSAILCPKCKTGYVNPIDGSHSVRYQIQLNWKCSKCTKMYSGGLIRTTIDEARFQFEKIDKFDSKDLETFLKKILRTLPPENALILDVKQSLIAAYRDVLRREPKPSKFILNRKLELCRELLPILEKIEPGISRLKGITLYEMHIPLVVLANREYEAGNITAEKLLAHLLEAELMIRDSIKMLLYEPKNSPEGRLARQALDELRMLGGSISSVKQIVANNANIVKKHRKKKNK